MRFLAVNHPRLGSTPGGIPEHIELNRHGLAARDAFARAVEVAIQERVHALFLTGDVIASSNSGLEPLGALADGIGALSRAGIPVVGVTSGVFNTETIASLGLADAVTFVDSRLDWHPPIVFGTARQDGPAIHIVQAALAEQEDAPTSSDVVTMEQIDHPGSIWLLTAPLQPDSLRGEHALVVEPGSPTPLHPNETNSHGVWLIDTDERSAELLPIGRLEFAAIDVDVAEAGELADVERMVLEQLSAHADAAAAEGSVAETLLVDVTLTGRTRLFAALPPFVHELERTIELEHGEATIATTAIHLDTTPDIDLEPLLNRPDPVGELARLINMFETDADRTQAQQALLQSARQRLLTVRHARVFGAVHDAEIASDPEALVKQQAWSLLDSLVRQRGIN